MAMICYLDEAGCPGRLPAGSSTIQPFLIIAAVALPSADISTFTRQFNALKRRYAGWQGHVGAQADPFIEIKGCELRAQLRKQPDGVSAEHRLLDHLFTLLVQFDVRVFAQVAPKPLGGAFDGKAVYATAMYRLACEFHGLFEHRCTSGSMLARQATLDAHMARPIYQAKFGENDALPRLTDVPMFGSSENHAGIQVADWLASALMFAELSRQHSTVLPEHAHLHKNDAQIAARYRKRLRKVAAPSIGCHWGISPQRMYGLGELLN